MNKKMEKYSWERLIKLCVLFPLSIHVLIHSIIPISDFHCIYRIRNVKIVWKQDHRRQRTVWIEKRRKSYVFRRWALFIVSIMDEVCLLVFNNGRDYYAGLNIYWLFITFYRKVFLKSR